MLLNWTSIGRSGPHVWRRVLVLHAFALALLLIAPATHASAHANLVHSDPASGSSIAVLPGSLRLEYSEGVTSLDVTVTNSGGERFDTGRAIEDTADQRLRTVPLRAGPDGIYTVTWHATSVDGHTTEGSFFFLVGSALPSREEVLAALSDAEAGGSSPNAIEIVGRVILFVSLTVVAAVVVASVVAPKVRSLPPLRRALRRATVLGAFGIAAGATILAMKQWAVGFGWTFEGAAAFLGTEQGVAWLWRSASALLAATVITRLDSPRAQLVVALGLTLCTQASISLVSHSQALLTGAGPVLVDFAHLAAGAMWGGGLLLLAVLLPAAYPDPNSPERQRITAEASRRFATVAIVSAGLVATAGLLLAAWHLGGWEPAGSTLYGRAAIAKTTLLALALILGAMHRLWLVRRIEEGARTLKVFTRSVRVEAGAVLGILVLSAVMTSAETSTAAAASGGGGGHVALSQVVRGTEVRLDVTPGKPGLNVFDVEFLIDGKPNGSAENVLLLLRLPTEDVELTAVSLVGDGAGRYSAVTALTQPGAWFARVAADVDGQFVAGRFSLPESRAPRTAYEADRGFARAARLGALSVVGLTLAGLVIEAAARRRARTVDKQGLVQLGPGPTNH